MSMLFELLPDDPDGSTHWFQVTPPLIEDVDSLLLALAEMPAHTYYITSVHPYGRASAQVVSVHWCDKIEPNGYVIMVADPADWNYDADCNGSTIYRTTSSGSFILSLGRLGCRPDTQWLCVRETERA